MTSYEDNQAAHRHAVQEAFPELSEAQVEAVHALWKYGRNGADGEYAIRQYLALECGVSDDEKIRKMFGSLGLLGLCLF